MAKISLIIYGILGLIWQVSCDYKNYSLIRVYPREMKEMPYFVQFADPDGQVEVLKKSRGVNDTMDLLVPPQRLKFVQDYIKKLHLDHDVKERDYSRVLNADQRMPKRRLNQNPWFEYSSYGMMLEYLDAVERNQPSLVRIQTIGTSTQGRPLKLVKISTNPDAGNPIILIDAGIHAREWVASAMALYIIHKLTNFKEAKLQELNGIDWYIIPMVNPDGYQYTRTAGRKQRMWRKTMSSYVSGCFGVDGNRNYAFKWAVRGVSSNPCDKETYAGPKAFSEPETRAVRDAMADNAKNLKLYVSLHAYGQYLVYPWGYTGDILPNNWKKLHSLAKKVSTAVERVGGPSFKVLSAGQWYPAAGGSDDYAFAVVGVPYSYTMELTDGHEFEFPEQLLPSTLPKLYEGFKAFGEQIKIEFGDQ